MNIIKYIFSKKYRDIISEEYSRELIQKFNYEEKEMERIYSSISLEKANNVA